MDISYNSNGLISKLIDGTSVVYYYNEYFQPVKILADMGEADIIYDDSMNIIETKYSN